jgi:hypothetical protein
VNRKRLIPSAILRHLASKMPLKHHNGIQRK